MIDFNVFSKQKVTIFILTSFLVLISYIFYKPSLSYSKNDLLVDVNKAKYYDLIKVPYIGEKTAKKIIELRNKEGYFKNIEDLKKFRNFKKFKYYIKVEGNAT